MTTKLNVIIKCRLWLCWRNCDPIINFPQWRFPVLLIPSWNIYEAKSRKGLGEVTTENGFHHEHTSRESFSMSSKLQLNYSWATELCFKYKFINKKTLSLWRIRTVIELSCKRLFTSSFRQASHHVITNVVHWKPRQRKIWQKHWHLSDGCVDGREQTVMHTLAYRHH